jgi:hypothetical protein
MQKRYGRGMGRVYRKLSNRINDFIDLLNVLVLSMVKIPNNEKLPVAKLAACFNNTTTTYKYYWFLSILEQIESGKQEITKREIFEGMIAQAWYTVHYFHISLGKQDKLQKANDYLKAIETVETNTKSIPLLEKELNIKQEDLVDKEEDIKDRYNTELEFAGDKLSNIELFKHYYKKDLSQTNNNQKVLEKVVELITSKTKGYTKESLLNKIKTEGELELHDSLVDIMPTALNYIYQKDVLKNKSLTKSNSRVKKNSNPTVCQGCRQAGSIDSISLYLYSYITTDFVKSLTCEINSLGLSINSKTSVNMI